MDEAALEQLSDAVKKLQKVFKLFYPGLSMQHQKLFQQFDKNGDGTLDYQEFLQGLDGLRSRANLTEQQKRLLIKQIDQNRTGIIKFQDFVNFLNQFEQKKKELEQQQEEQKKIEEQQQQQQEKQKEEEKQKKQDPPSQDKKGSKKGGKKEEKPKQEEEKKNPEQNGVKNQDNKPKKGVSASEKNKQPEQKSPIKKPAKKSDVELDNSDLKSQKSSTQNASQPKKKAPISQKQPQKQSQTILSHLILEDTSISEQYEKTLQSLQSTEKFTDPDFPPEESSITKDVSTFAKASELTWARATDILKGSQLKIFEGQIEPNDIKQGGLGDCYFLSSLSVLAEGAELVSRLFESREPNSQGCYCVWLCHDAEWRQIIMDDYFPIMKQQQQQKQLAFSRSHGDELWVVLLEKAYAKVYGAYDKIEAGLTGHALRDLTGAPAEFMKNDAANPDKSWDFIMQNQERKYLLTAGSQQSDKGKEVENQSGIISGHAYAILQAAEVTAADGEKARLVQLRNPWGSKEWTGAWSDASDKWTPELRQRLGVKEEDDGAFFMPVEDFCREFSEVSVCKLHQDYFYSWRRVELGSNKNKQQKKAGIVKFSVQEEQIHGFIQVSQSDERNFAKQPGVQYEYSQLRLIVYRGSGLDAQESLIADNFKSERDVYVEIDLKKGDYCVYVEADWLQDFVNNLVVSAYTEKAVQFDTEVIKIDVDGQDQLGLIKKLALLKQPREEKVTHYEEDREITKWSENIAGYVYVLYSNDSQQGAKLSEQVNVQAENLLACAPLQNVQHFEVELSAGQKEVILFKVAQDAKGAYGFGQEISYSVSVHLSDEQLLEQAKQQKAKQRSGDNGPIEVYFYTLFYDEGAFVLYENQTQQVFNEELQLKLKNLEGVDFDASQMVKVRIEPGGTFTLKLKPIDTNEATSFGCSFSCWLE